MKQIIVYIIAFYAILTLSSCEDNQQVPSIQGNWKYQKPHFEFEYAQDSICLEMNQGKKISIAASDVKGMFMGIAAQKMSAYFEGIEFTTENQLNIVAQTAIGIPMKIKASYLRSDKLIQLTLDQEQMSKLLGPAASQIPPISLKYSVEDQQMTIYLDAVYLQVIYSMLEDGIVPMLVKQVIPMFDRLPENAKSQIVNAFKLQIQGIFDNILRLQVGVVLQTSK